MVAVNLPIEKAPMSLAGTREQIKNKMTRGIRLEGEAVRLSS
jgi:hypothetical protein